MKIQLQIEEIKNTLAKGETNKVFEDLRKLLQGNSFLDEVFVLAARGNKLKKDIRLNIINRENANIEYSQINSSILEILNEFERELKEKNSKHETGSESSYTRSIIDLGRGIQSGHKMINNKEENLKLSILLDKISALLELKIERIEKGDDLNGTLGKLELYKDYLPDALNRSKGLIKESLAQKILTKINEAYRKKAEYIISINEAKLYDISNKENLIRELKIASGYFSETAEILR